ncbi:GerAB/ArcD/ProY family transporter [Paenibacillus hamazuiensis]|uniref:GerAB/ArcD/ProY family transporter n=1 Tax=Paenibacillus hamazuiensis TaxID=2936508 RepID=UPI00200F8BA1|nr:GerAB/ArcD/ProY family transporter [Paenibacillus hamazuiensis]
MDKSLQVTVMYLLTHVGLIFFMYPTEIIESVPIGHWSPILLGFLFHVTLLGIFTKGLSYFKSQNLIDIFLGAGKAFAVILLVPVTFYFLMEIVIMVRAYSEIIKMIFLENTPIWAIIALLLAVTTMISSLGIETVFRTGLLIAVLFLPIFLLVLSISFQNADWRYVFPLMDERAVSLSYVLSRPFLLSLFAFAGGFTFLGFIQPYIPYKRRSVMGASALLLPLFLISVYVPLLTFGQNTVFELQFPFITAIDTVNITWLMFDRVTMFFMITLICFVLLFFSLVMWKATLLIRRALPFIRPIPAKLLLALALFILCLQIPDFKTVEQLLWWNTFLRLYVTIAIPFITLILGIRHHRKGAVFS